MFFKRNLQQGCVGVWTFYMLRLMPLKGRRRKRSFTNISHSFSVWLNKERCDLKHSSLGGIFPILSSPFLLFHASIKIFLFCNPDREASGRKERLVGNVEWEIRSEILLICQFFSCIQCLAKHKRLLSLGLTGGLLGEIRQWFISLDVRGSSKLTKLYPIFLTKTKYIGLFDSR